MKSINKIPPGSIVLVNGKTRFSKLIRLFSPKHRDDMFTHAGIYVGGPKKLLCHQVGVGTTLQPAQEEFDTCYDVSVWTNPNIDRSIIDKVVNQCFAISKPYDTAEIKSIAMPWIRRGDGLICTELVLVAYKNAGYPLLGDKVEKVSPNELKEALEKDRNWKLCFKISDGIDNI